MFLQAAYRDNTLGLPKLCPPENLLLINSATVKSFMKRYYTPSRMVVAGVNVDHEELVRLTKKYFVNAKPVWHEDGSTEEEQDNSLAQYTGGIVKVCIAKCSAKFLNANLDLNLVALVGFYCKRQRSQSLCSHIGRKSILMMKSTLLM